MNSQRKEEIIKTVLEAKQRMRTLGFYGVVFFDTKEEAEFAASLSDKVMTHGFQPSIRGKYKITFWH